MQTFLFFKLKGHYFLPLLPQFAAPTFRHRTTAPLAYADGHTLYRDFTFCVQASPAFFFPKGILVFPFAV